MKPSVNVNQLSDEQLVTEIIKTNDSALFAVLYDRYAPVVFNKCLGFSKNKAEAEDLTHDIFIKLYIKLKSFKGNSKFSTWLYSFTYNFCVNYVQRDAYRNKEQVNEEAVEKRSAVVDEVSDEDFFQLKAKKLGKVLSLIDPNDKMVLLMKYQDDFSIKDISQSLGLGESAVKMRIKRAKERVMELYKKI